VICVEHTHPMVREDETGSRRGNARAEAWTEATTTARTEGTEYATIDGYGQSRNDARRDRARMVAAKR
jgi:hypothetical protein